MVNVFSVRSEIILYDRTPGGAGFVRDGVNNWLEVVEQARAICESCTCEKACYGCLKDYSNQSYHKKLDRRNAGEYLEVLEQESLNR